METDRYGYRSYVLSFVQQAHVEDRPFVSGVPFSVFIEKYQPRQSLQLYHRVMAIPATLFSALIKTTYYIFMVHFREDEFLQLRIKLCLNEALGWLCTLWNEPRGMFKVEESLFYQKLPQFYQRNLENAEETRHLVTQQQYETLLTSEIFRRNCRVETLLLAVELLSFEDKKKWVSTYTDALPVARNKFSLFTNNDAVALLEDPEINVGKLITLFNMDQWIYVAAHFPIVRILTWYFNQDESEEKDKQFGSLSLVTKIYINSIVALNARCLVQYAPDEIHHINFEQVTKEEFINFSKDPSQKLALINQNQLEVILKRFFPAESWDRIPICILPWIRRLIEKSENIEEDSSNEEPLNTELTAEIFSTAARIETLSSMAQRLPFEQIKRWVLEYTETLSEARMKFSNLDFRAVVALFNDPEVPFGRLLLLMNGDLWLHILQPEHKICQRIVDYFKEDESDEKDAQFGALSLMGKQFLLHNGVFSARYLTQLPLDEYACINFELIPLDQLVECIDHLTKQITTINQLQLNAISMKLAGFPHDSLNEIVKSLPDDFVKQLDLRLFNNESLEIILREPNPTSDSRKSAREYFKSRMTIEQFQTIAPRLPLPLWNAVPDEWIHLIDFNRVSQSQLRVLLGDECSSYPLTKEVRLKFSQRITLEQLKIVTHYLDTILLNLLPSASDGADYFEQICPCLTPKQVQQWILSCYSKWKKGEENVPMWVSRTLSEELNGHDINDIFAEDELKERLRLINQYQGEILLSVTQASKGRIRWLEKLPDPVAIPEVPLAVAPPRKLKRHKSFGDLATEALEGREYELSDDVQAGIMARYPDFNPYQATANPEHNEPGDDDVREKMSPLHETSDTE